MDFKSKLKLTHPARLATLVTAFLFCAPLCQAESKSTPVATKTSSLRLASLAPSNSELIASLDAQPLLVGRSNYCDFPPGLSTVPVVGTFVSANIERLTMLKPDYVLLVSGQESLAASLKHNNFNTLVLVNSHVSDIWDNIKALGKLTAKEPKAQLLADKIKAAVTAIGITIKNHPLKTTVFYCVWPSPLMTAGKASFLNDVITTCGGTNIAGNLSAAYPTFSMERLRLADPDVIILPHEALNQSFIKKSPWVELKAVKNKRVFYLPEAKQDMLARPTMRILDGISWLSVKIRPDLKSEIDGWSKRWQN